MPIVVLVSLLAVMSFLVAYFFFEVTMFRLSCRLARVELPQRPRVLWVVLVAIVIGLVSASVIAAAMDQIYSLGGFPIWEASLVGLFAELPVHMILVSLAHARIVRIGFRDALSVWFIEKLLKLVIFGGIGTVFVVLLLLARALFG